MDAVEPTPPNASPVAALLAPLPDQVDADSLRELLDAELQSLRDELSVVERATLAAMAPYDRQLREIRARTAQLATEERRRERAAKHRSRKLVRDQAGSANLPSLRDALEAPTPPLPEEQPLRDTRAYLRTGGEVGFGFATRPGTITFSDGRQQRAVGTIGEARALYEQGWEPGTATIPGVRVHLIGTRIERVVSADEVVMDRASPAAHSGRE